MKINTLKVSILLTAGCLIFSWLEAGSAKAAPDDLDQTFGDGGKVITNFTSIGDHTRRIRLQGDGKILTLTTDGVDEIGVPRWASIHRHTSTGLVDSTFGTGGKIIVSGLRDFAVLPDGRLILAITNYALTTTTQIMRFSSDGHRDLNFGTVSVAGTGRLEGRRVQIQPDGKILVGGATGGWSTFFARFHPNGEPDTSFGNGGISYSYGTDFAYTLVGFWTIDSTGDFVIQPDGKITYGFGAGWDDAYHIARINSDGTEDIDFGSNGVTRIPTYMPGYPYETFSFGISLLSSGKLVVTGTSVQWYGNESIGSVARLNADGSLDTAFGNNGNLTLTSGSRGPASSILVLADGSILVGGMVDSNFALIRLTRDGQVDRAFGVNGIIRTPIGQPGSNSILSTAMQTDGKVVAAGNVMTMEGYRLGLVRYSDLSMITKLATVTGRVFAPDGRGLRNAVVSITDIKGVGRSVATSSLGYYTFDEVAPGSEYTVSVKSKLYRFTSRNVMVQNELTSLNFIGLE